MSNIAKFIDHTILKPDARTDDVVKLCDEAIRYGFCSVCVNSCNTSLVGGKLKDSGVLTCVVVGFPLGAMSVEAKAFETSRAIEDGADEIDMVLNIGRLKDGDYDYVVNDIKSVVDAAQGRPVKVILENCLLTDEEKSIAVELSIKAGAQFVKTSTGFSTGGATVEDIGLMKSVAAGRIRVKASGGIRNYDAAISMIEAGADRIGASSSVKILEEEIHSL
ncbi:MAG: deoxyribose-phosphate aldolase [Christensenellales bacterium]|jgi:deoxyribose-phosphate aldolase